MSLILTPTQMRTFNEYQALRDRPRTTITRDLYPALAAAAQQFDTLEARLSTDLIEWLPTHMETAGAVTPFIASLRAKFDELSAMIEAAALADPSVFPDIYETVTARNDAAVDEGP